MKLKRLRIQNFRGYKDVTVDFSDFNCIVGKNDVGKTTMFRALECFFDYSKTIDKYDYNGIIDGTMNQSKETYQISITADIECSEKKLLPFCDNGVEQGVLRIKKKYEINSSSDKCTFVYSFGVRKSFFKSNKLESIIEDNQLKTNLEIYRDINLLKPEMPDEYTRIEEYGYIVYIPVLLVESFSLPFLFSKLPKFKFLTSATSLNEIQELFFKQKLSNQFSELSKSINELNIFGSGLHFNNDSISVNNQIFTTIESEEGDKRIPLDNRGEGYQLTVRNDIFRKLSELDSAGEIILAFEEPESHLHPSKQAEVYYTLKSLSDDYQVMITTHSPTIVSLCDKNDIIHVVKDEYSQTSTILQQSPDVGHEYNSIDNTYKIAAFNIAKQAF